MSKNDRIMVLTLRFATVAFFLIFWEAIVRTGHVSAFYTSYPTEIARDLLEFLSSGALVKHAGITLQEALWGLFYGIIFGMSLGVFFGQFAIIGKALKPLVTALYGIPQLALAPIYILWFGLGLTSKIFLAGLMAFFQVFFATYGAIHSMDQKLIESAHLLGASRLQILFHVVIPTSSPWIITGIRTALGSSLIGAIVGEYMGSSSGFGWMIAYATSYFNIKRVMSCLLILLLVGLLLNYGIDKLENLILRWRPKMSLSFKKEQGIF